MGTKTKNGDIQANRDWNRDQPSPVEEILMFHDDQGRVHETYHRLRAVLQREGIEYVVIGAYALAVHRHRRATEDVDLCVRAADLKKFRERLLGKEYEGVEGRNRRFCDPRTGVTFDLLVSGAIAGRRDKNNEVLFPDPSEAIVIDGLPTVTLERLIALKLVTWRRQDWADVIALIRKNELDEGFAQKLPGALRSAFLQCHDEMVEEDRYEREHDEEGI